MRFVDLTPRIKAAVVMAMAEHARLTQFLPTDNIFSQQVPANQAYPYSRLGTAISTPYLSSCWSGTSCRITIDVFAEAGPGAEAGEVQVGLITSLILEAMQGLKVEGAGLLENEYLGQQTVMVDQEADRWRAIIEFNVTAVVKSATA